MPEAIAYAYTPNDIVARSTKDTVIPLPDWESTAVSSIVVICFKKGENKWSLISLKEIGNLIDEGFRENDIFFSRDEQLEKINEGLEALTLKELVTAEGNGDERTFTVTPECARLLAEG